MIVKLHYNDSFGLIIEVLKDNFRFFIVFFVRKKGFELLEQLHVPFLTPGTSSARVRKKVEL